MNVQHTSCVTRVAKDIYLNLEVPIRSVTLTWWPPGTPRRAPCFASTTRRWSSAWRSTRGGRSGRRTSTSRGYWRSCRFVSYLFDKIFTEYVNWSCSSESLNEVAYWKFNNNFSNNFTTFDSKLKYFIICIN